MNGSIRVSAKTVDDAITEALIQLGVTSDRLEYEVIEKGSAGFLGIGMKQAVIEARRKPEPKEEKVEEPVVEEPVRVEPKKVEAVQPQKAAAEKKADEPQKAAFEKAVEKEAKEEVKKETKLVEVQPQTIKAVEDFLKCYRSSVSLYLMCNVLCKVSQSLFSSCTIIFCIELDLHITICLLVYYETCEILQRIKSSTSLTDQRSHIFSCKFNIHHIFFCINGHFNRSFNIHCLKNLAQKSDCNIF